MTFLSLKTIKTNVQSSLIKFVHVYLLDVEACAREFLIYFVGIHNL